jgi:tetratricopeptide (TPR) repeat protein
MNQNHFVLYDHKKPIKLQAERVSFYLQGEIIEAFSESNEVYYLFFYQYRFLTAVKATKLRRQSYIEHAFKKGMVFTAPHPFINVLLASDHSCHVLSFKQLVKKLEMLYTPQENAFILTFFESFIPRKQLFDEIKSKYYEYRRNGQMFLGYRIVRILMDFVPKHSLVKTLANDIGFHKYAVLYNQKSEELFAKDIIFAEKTLYSQKENDQCFQKLVSHLESQSRWIDLIALLTEKLTVIPSTDYYSPLIKLLEQHLNEDESAYILERLASQLTDFIPLQKDLFTNYIRIHKIEWIFDMMSNHDFKLSDAQVQAFGDMLDHFDTKTNSLQPQMLISLLKSVMVLFPENAEKLLNLYVITLLKTHDLAYIKDWIEPIKEINDNLQVFGKIDLMQTISDELDDMQTLGELYYEFRQMDKAIECFDWEMELKPADPKPLQWLAKIYREKGMNQESDIYRQLCVNLQKWA